MFEILQLALEKIKDVKKRHKKFIFTLIKTITICQGKTTFKNMSRYSKESEKYFNRWYKIPFNFFKLNSLLLFQSLFISKDLIVALDASFIPKSGKKKQMV
jgi:hypothetical protein